MCGEVDVKSKRIEDNWIECHRRVNFLKMNLKNGTLDEFKKLSQERKEIIIA